jgi:hypothetical protein
VSEAFKSQIILGQQVKEDSMSCASTDAASKFDSFVSVAKDVNVTIIKPKQFKPIIIKQESSKLRLHRLRLLQKLLASQKSKT